MAKTNTVIEINGTRYDATTGERLAGAVPKPKAVKKATPATAKTGVQRQPARHAAAHAPKQTQTLMRKAVKKPAAASRLKASVPVDALVTPPLATINLPQSVKQLDPRRLERARHVRQSAAIQHFSVRPSTPGTVFTPAITQPPVAHHSKTPVKQPGNSTNDLLERALQAATSHEQPPHKLHRRSNRTKRRLAIGGGTAAALFILAVVGSQDLSGLRLHMASARAGIAATLPAHQPAGYRLGHVQSSPGEIATDFQSNSGGTSYSLTQKATLLDSDSIRESFVASTDPNYRTVVSDGLTIYLYGDQDATWVRNGIWYQLNSNGSLNDRELVDLATNQ